MLTGNCLAEAKYWLGFNWSVNSELYILFQEQNIKKGDKKAQRHNAKKIKNNNNLRSQKTNLIGSLILHRFSQRKDIMQEHAYVNWNCNLGKSLWMKMGIKFSCHWGERSYLCYFFNLFKWNISNKKRLIKWTPICQHC